MLAISAPPVSSASSRSTDCVFDLKLESTRSSFCTSSIDVPPAPRLAIACWLTRPALSSAAPAAARSRLVSRPRESIA